MAQTILIIDDDRGMVKLLESGLAQVGYQVLSANTGEGGLQIAENKEIDLILLDVILPGMKGREVCKKLKENEKTKLIPVIFLTAKDSEDDVKAEMDVGGIAHITKPIDLNGLIPKVMEILPRKII
ncbi:MAG: response regulator [Candidatus Omnitrophica bacterium]|nr:response regulator [Candidatus Omnitrophota bacterium]